MLTELLPFLNQLAVYNLINRQAPWDDASNRQAMSVVIPVFLDPNQTGKTTDPATGCALAHYAGNKHIFGERAPLSDREFTDGLANTMLAGSVTTGLRPWGDPSNLRDPAAGIGPAPTQFDSAARGQVLILLANGSVRSISVSTSPQVMSALAKPNDGVIPPSDLNLLR